MTLPAELARIGLVLEGDELVRQGRRVSRTFDEIQEAAGKSVGGVNQAQGALDGFVGQMRRLAGLAGVALGVGQVIQYAESWKGVEARLKLVTKDSDELRMVQMALFDQAQRAGNGFTQIAQTYQSLAQAVKGAGYESKDLLAVTDGVNALLRISGKSAADAAGPMMQLSQAFGSGALRGDEFNAIAEGMPGILDLVAKEMGKPREQMRSLAAQGKITVDILISAFKKQNDELQKTADQIPMKIGGAITQFTNILMKNIGEFDKTIGMTDKMAAAIQWLTKNLNIVTPILVTMAALLLANAIAAGTFAVGITAATGAVARFGVALVGGARAIAGIGTALAVAGSFITILTGIMVAAIPVAIAFVASLAPLILTATMLAAPLVLIGIAIKKMVDEKRAAKAATDALAAAQVAATKKAAEEEAAQRKVTDALVAQTIYRSQALAAATKGTQQEIANTERIAAALASGGPKAAEKVRQQIEQDSAVREKANTMWAAFVKEVGGRDRKLAATLSAYTDVYAASAAKIEGAAYIIGLANKAIADDRALGTATTRAEAGLERSKERIAARRQSLMAEADAIMDAKNRLAEQRTALSDQLVAGIADPLQREKAQLAIETRRLEAQIRDATANIFDPGAVKWIEDAMRNQFVLGKQITVVLAEQADRQQAFASRTAEVKRVTEEAAKADQEFLALQAQLAGERERQLRQPLENALRSVQSLLADTFDKFFSRELKSANDFGQALVQIARKTASEMAAQFLMSKALGLFSERPQQTRRPVVGTYDISDLIPSLTDILRPRGPGNGLGSGGVMDRQGSRIIEGIGSLLAGIHHTGGVVGAATAMRTVSPLLFDGASRTADLSLRPNEIPIIAQRGEQIVPVTAAPKDTAPAPQLNFTMPLTIQALDATDLDGAIERAAPKIQEIVARGVSQSPRYAQHLRGR